MMISYRERLVVKHPWYVHTSRAVSSHLYIISVPSVVQECSETQNTELQNFPRLAQVIDQITDDMVSHKAFQKCHNLTHSQLAFKMYQVLCHILKFYSLSLKNEWLHAALFHDVL